MSKIRNCFLLDREDVLHPETHFLYIVYPSLVEVEVPYSESLKVANDLDFAKIFPDIKHKSRCSLIQWSSTLIPRYSLSPFFLATFFLCSSSWWKALLEEEFRCDAIWNKVLVGFHIMNYNQGWLHTISVHSIGYLRKLYNLQR